MKHEKYSDRGRCPDNPVTPEPLQLKIAIPFCGRKPTDFVQLLSGEHPWIPKENELTSKMDTQQSFETLQS